MNQEDELPEFGGELTSVYETNLYMFIMWWQSWLQVDLFSIWILEHLRGFKIRVLLILSYYWKRPVIVSLFLGSEFDRLLWSDLLCESAVVLCRNFTFTAQLSFIRSKKALLRYSLTLKDGKSCSIGKFWNCLIRC